ncbi:MAG: ATP-dependent Clp protease ATP-binding subunit [Candidatus Krumholzibacteria bacterium]|nr:ATP-dependent Clp protease ATP-binding subunit [Candidatus Krumholzibacteria bacterium]
MNDRFTQRVRKVLFLARDEAGRLQHEYIGTEHLLLGIIREGEGIAANVMRRLGLDFERIQQEIEATVSPMSGPVSIGEIPFTPRAKKVLELSIDESRLHNHKYVGTEHLLLALIREGEGIAADVLNRLGADHETVKREVMKALGAAGGRPGAAVKKKDKKENPVLEQFGRNMTEMARQGQLDPTIGREKEIERVIQILSRRKKNNPVLIGEPGVGKTAIVEGFASRIVENKVPGVLREKEIITLDLASVVAGTKYRGQFEERLKQIMGEIRENSDIIIFIDELHTIVGAGGAEGAIDASNMLKPALSRGEIQCIGATTMDEYRKFIEKDGALERRFQSVIVNPPTEEQTVEILYGLRDKYEAHHRVTYSDEALSGAVYLSNRYISGRSLPDKAIDIIDEAGSRARLSATEVPPDLRAIETRIEEVVKEKESSIQAQEFEKAARFRDQEKELKKELLDLKQSWHDQKSERQVTVDQRLICKVISDITGIPITDVEEEETKKLLRMEDELRKWIVGQDAALEAVSKSIRRNRAGLRDPKRPIGSFIFLGPTGVGKTEVARRLTEFLFGDQTSLIRIDMSEYMEKHAVSRLVGAPPGYVGYEEGGMLTERVRRHPYSVILLDEIEKAHPDVFNILLQVLEDGNLTDSFGRTVDFRNTVLIMTSNVGNRKMHSGRSLGFASDADDQEKQNQIKARANIDEDVKKTFSPEFLNRIDERVMFESLGRPELHKIVDILLRDVTRRLDNLNIEFEFTEAAKDMLCDLGYDPAMGARPLRRAIQRYLEDPLSERLLRGEITGNCHLRIDAGNKQLLFTMGPVVKTPV